MQRQVSLDFRRDNLAVLWQRLPEGEGIATVISTINELVRSIAQSISEQSRVAKEIAADIASANSGVAQANELVTSNAGVAQSIAKDVADVTVSANKIRDVSNGLKKNSDRLFNFSKGLRELVATFKY